MDEFQKNRRWDLDSAVCLEPDEEEQGLKEFLFTTGNFYRNAWYCPKCEKALCVFSRDEGRDEWMAQPKTAEEERERTPPEQKPERPEPPPPPQRRPKPRDDPWEKKGLFGRRKKSDREK